MAKFCGQCGSTLSGTAVFCGACGAPIPATGASPVAPSAASSYNPGGAYHPAPPNPSVSSYSPAPSNTPGTIAPEVPAKKSNTLLKVIVACVLLLVAGSALALGGLWYAAQQVKQKAQAVAAQSPGLGSMLGSLGGLAGSSAGGAGDDGSTEFKGDPCRFLSTQEVSQAVGLTVLRAEGEQNDCKYIVRGDMAAMKAKHLSSMIGPVGGDAKTQKMVEGLAGTFFSVVKPPDAESTSDEVNVLEIDFEGHAQLAMKANRGAFNYVSGNGGSAKSSGSGDLDGIGDDAYVVAGGMLMVRKGDTMARMTYTICPCGTEAIKPLAKLVASRL